MEEKTHSEPVHSDIIAMKGRARTVTLRFDSSQLFTLSTSSARRRRWPWDFVSISGSSGRSVVIIRRQ